MPSRKARNLSERRGPSAPALSSLELAVRRYARREAKALGLDRTAGDREVPKLVRLARQTAALHLQGICPGGCINCLAGVRRSWLHMEAKLPGGR